MTEKLLRLIQAILTRAKDREGFVTKTKLVKYLYLIDIAHYKRTGQLLTGFSWFFHLYGPWAREFENLYGQATFKQAIRVRPGTKPDLDAEFIESTETVQLSDVIEDVHLELEFRHIIDTWADRRLGEMLDHVYFNSEPMHVATQGEELDFSSVERTPMQRRIWQPTHGDRTIADQVRRRIAERLGLQQKPKPEQFTPPRYDEEYFDAVRIMDEDEGG